jgi:SOS response regulatory protein OraA/RecX
MEKTLQVQYNLIKEGKGDKAYFLKSAYRLFPDMLSPVNTFEDTTRILKNRGIISENIGGLVTTGKKQDWHAIFNENITALKEEKEAKAEEKETTKEVTDMATRGYDYKDEKNYDNIFGEEFLKGYYTEMKDPKNADKDVEELRAIVAKNLAKDISYYVKNGQFGVKGLGYTTEAPGLGTPKEAKGKFKSSGYGDLKESVLRLAIQDLIKEVLSEEKEFSKGDKVTYNGEEVEIVGKSMWAKTDGSDSSVPQPITYDLKTKDGVVKDISPKSLSEALDMDAIKNEGENAKKKVMERRITNEIVKRKKQIKALETLTELEGGEDNEKKIKELQSEIKKLDGAKAKLHKVKEIAYAGAGAVDDLTKDPKLNTVKDKASLINKVKQGGTVEL